MKCKNVEIFSERIAFFFYKSHFLRSIFWTTDYINIHLPLKSQLFNSNLEFKFQVAVFVVGALVQRDSDSKGNGNGAGSSLKNAARNFDSGLYLNNFVFARRL
ncbi:MAG: hypothetical protein LBT59_25835, partial [Clostridiales bacterium]|nr:hypothetical protein [Clostridiales bacterium]